MIYSVSNSNLLIRLKGLIKHAILLIAILFSSFSFSQFDIPDIPKEQTSVYDYINLLSASEKNTLENKKKELCDSTSTIKQEMSNAFQEIRLKLQKKEKEIIELETTNMEVEFKRKINQNLFLATFGILLLTILMVYNMLKSSKRKSGIQFRKHDL